MKSFLKWSSAGYQLFIYLMQSSEYSKGSPEKILAGLMGVLTSELKLYPV